MPIKKHIFYRQVYDALFDWHDATKDGYNTREKKSGLDIDTFPRVLRVVGFVSVMTGEVEGDTDAVLGWIRKARAICSNTQFSESNFLDDLVRAVPLFVKDGDSYRWSHKSLAEYFAAQYICTEGKQQQGQILGAFLETGRIGRFSNVLDQIYDIDAVAFRTHLILPLAKVFSAYWSSAYRSSDASIDIAAINLRKELMFDRSVALFSIQVLESRKFDTEIAPLMRVRGIGPESSADASLLLYMHDNQFHQVIAINQGPFAVILGILASKRDPLVRKFNPESGPIGRPQYRLSTTNSPHLINDAPEMEYNRPGTFSKFTSALLKYPSSHLVDSEKMLQFEKSFQDTDRLAALANELVNPLLDNVKK